MAQIKVRINGRHFDIACDDGEEEHVARLGQYVDSKVAELAERVGQVGDARLVVMAALVIADELSEAYGKIEATQAGRAKPAESAANGEGATTATQFRALARRIEDIAAGLERA